MVEYSPVSVQFICSAYPELTLMKGYSNALPAQCRVVCLIFFAAVLGAPKQLWHYSPAD